MTLTPHYTTIPVLILPVTKADCVSDLQPTPIQHTLLWSNGSDVSLHCINIDGPERDRPQLLVVLVLDWKPSKVCMPGRFSCPLSAASVGTGVANKSK
jgi:hypothetical protein